MLVLAEKPVLLSTRKINFAVQPQPRGTGTLQPWPKGRNRTSGASLSRVIHFSASFLLPAARQQHSFLSLTDKVQINEALPSRCPECPRGQAQAGSDPGSPSAEHRGARQRLAATRTGRAGGAVFCCPSKGFCVALLLLPRQIQAAELTGRVSEALVLWSSCSKGKPELR